MEFRKLIKFGESSHIVSLPNEWVKKNNLKKGDLIYFEQNGNNELVLAPNKREKLKLEKEISIIVDGKSRKPLVREIVAAYLDNYTIIKFIGNEVAKKSELLREITQNMVALEIIEQTNKSIIVKDFLDIDTISIDSLIKKIDLIVRAVFLDMLDLLDGKESESINQKEKDVNKLAFLTERGIRYNLETNKSGDPLQLLANLHFVTRMEILADEIKRFCRLFKVTKLDKQTFAKIKEILIECNDLYVKTVRSFNEKDKKLAYELASKKDLLISDCDSLYKKMSNKGNTSVLIDKLRAIVVKTKELGRAAY